MILKDTIEKRFRQIQNIRRIVFSPRFEQIFSGLDSNEKENITNIVLQEDLKKIKEYLDNIDGGPVMKLRYVARSYGVKNYLRLSRKQLKEELANAKAKYSKDVK